MNKNILIAFAMFILATVSCSINTAEENWTHFRGNKLNGISDTKHAPLFWSDSENIFWKKETAGKGWSSPVVFANQVWLTSASPDGTEMYGICIDFKSGREVYNISLFKPETVQSKHKINTHATPTPCIEKDFVYLHFGTYGTACIRTTDGSIVWKRTDLNCEHVQGPGSSPILYKDLLILHIEGSDVQYIIALDKHTGNTVWRTDRPAECYDKLSPIGKKAYITPIIINTGSRDLLISNGSAACIAYDPETGEEVWRVVQGEDSTIAMPFSEDNIVFFYTSFVTQPDGGQYCELLAVDPDGTGDITDTNIIWRVKSPVLQLLTPVIKDGFIYTIDTENNLLCLDSETGTTVYSKHLTSRYNASPIYAAGNIYFNSIRGETLIIHEGRNLETVGNNKLSGEVFATPAILRNSILIRTNNFLYRIGDKAEGQ